MSFWDEPPTDPQKLFAEKKLGITVTPEMSKRDLALLVIEKRQGIKSDHPPTIKEAHFAISLGVEFEPCVAQIWEVVPALHAAIEQKTAEALSRNPDLLTPGTPLVYKGAAYTVRDGHVDTQWKIYIVPVESKPGRRTKNVHVITIAAILAGEGVDEHD